MPNAQCPMPNPKGKPIMITLTQDYQITWEKLPDDYKLPDDPVDNINQPALAAALTESLQLAGINFS